MRPALPRATSSLSVVLLAVALGACTAEDASTAPAAAVTVQQPGAPGEPPRTLSVEEVEQAMDQVPGPSEEDVAFVQAMVPHHEQALQMTSLVPGRASSERVKVFAERMDATQQAEIDQMQDWLLGLGEVFGPDGDHHHGDRTMAGMLTEEQMTQLEDAEGEPFDRLFLELMTQHHLGAVAMVEQLRESEGGGQDSAVWQLADHIESDQRIELDRMAGMLDDLGAG